MDLGTTGIWTTYRAIGEENAGEAARLVEDLGFGVFWLGGSPRLPQRAPAAGGDREPRRRDRIVNVWAYEPAQLAAEYAALAADFPERLLVGIGVGHPEATSDYSKAAGRDARRSSTASTLPPPLPTHRRCLAALGPKMLELSAERSLGAIPYFVAGRPHRVARSRARHRAAARSRSGVSSLDDDTERARDKAREYAADILSGSRTTRTTCCDVASARKTSPTAGPTD